MKKKNLIIILVLIVVAIIGAWYVKNKKQQIAENQKKQQEELVKKENQNQEIDTSDWKIYRDEKYKFEIKYDPEWRVKEARNTQAGEDGLFILIDGNYGINVGAEEVLTQEKPQVWLERKITKMKAKKENEKVYKINNNKIYYSKIIVDNSYNQNTYVISNNGSLISFYFSDTSEKENSETGTTEKIDYSRYIAAFEKMVNSVKFFNSNDENGLTYYKIDELGVKFKTSKEFADSFKYSFEKKINKKIGDEILIAYFPCGVLIKSNKPHLEYESGYYEGSEFSRKMGLFYIIFQPHHEFDLKNDICYDTKVRISFSDLIDNLETIN